MMYKNIFAALIFSMFFSQIVNAETCETSREQFFDQADTKVWTSTICPNQKLPFHKHNHARVGISQENGTLEVLYKDGRSKKIEFEKNKPVYLSIQQGKDMHQDINISNHPMHITIIELKNAINNN